MSWCPRLGLEEIVCLSEPVPAPYIFSNYWAEEPHMLHTFWFVTISTTIYIFEGYSTYISSKQVKQKINYLYIKELNPHVAKLSKSICVIFTILLMFL